MLSSPDDLDELGSGADGNNGYCYYLNRQTLETSWNPWVQVRCAQGKYYFNVETHERSWKAPRSSLGVIGGVALRRALSEEGKRALLKAL